MNIIKSTVVFALLSASTITMAVVEPADRTSSNDAKDNKIDASQITVPNQGSNVDLNQMSRELERELQRRQSESRQSQKDTQRQQAFDLMVESLLPLEPEEVIKVRKLLDEAKKAAATPPNPPPTPNFSSTHVNLEPGSFPPVIRLSAGFVSSLLFLDSTGAPWPIAAYSLGDPQTFNIQWDQKSNTLFIQSLKEYAHTNMAIQLANLNTPIMLTLVSGQKNVDFRIDMQVTGRGPNAKPLISAETLYDPQVNSVLMNILDGIPPRDSTILKVSGGYGDAWLANNRLYFRTKLTILSPAWTSSVTGPDGTRVFEMMPTPHILASGEGKTIDIKITGM